VIWGFHSIVSQHTKISNHTHGDYFTFFPWTTLKMEASSSPITSITNYQPRLHHMPEDFIKLLCQTMHMVHSKGSANYDQSCVALLEFFSDTIKCGNYGPVQKIKSCDLYFKF